MPTVKGWVEYMQGKYPDIPADDFRYVLKLAAIPTLLHDIEADFGFEYGTADGAAALKELRSLVGGTPAHNMRD